MRADGQRGGDPRRRSAARGLHGGRHHGAARRRRVLRRPRGRADARAAPLGHEARDGRPRALPPTSRVERRDGARSRPAGRRRARRNRLRGRRGRGRPAGADRPGRRAARRRGRLLTGGERPSGVRRRVLADLAVPPCADAAAPHRLGAGRRHGQRGARAARGRARAPGDRDRRQPPRAPLHRAERRAQRPDERRDPAGKPLRARRRRALRPDHVQRPVRRLARAALGLPRRRVRGGRALRADRPRGCPTPV